MLRSAAAPQATLQKREVTMLRLTLVQHTTVKVSGLEVLRTRDQVHLMPRTPEPSLV
jgi:hypothetical protein